MAWKTILNKEQVSIVYDDERNHVLLELNSGGLRPKFVTLHLDQAGIDEFIEHLQLAKKEITEA